MSGYLSVEGNDRDLCGSAEDGFSFIYYKPLVLTVQQVLDP
jgi:hypothetical protein